MAELKPPLYTSTGELFQLVRIYYHVFNQPSVLRMFKKLRCVDFDPTRNRWVWLFEHEAKKLQLGKPYNEVSQQSQSIVIGAFTFRGNDQMLLDVRSVERATQAIEFFDKRMNRRMAEVTNLRILNKLFEGTPAKLQQLLQQSSDVFFDRDDIVRSGEALMEKIEEFKKEEDINTRRRQALAWIEQHAQAPLPEVEEMPTHFYEEGIEPLKLSLKLRQMELMERWHGKKGANVLNIIKKLATGIKSKNLS